VNVVTCGDEPANLSDKLKIRGLSLARLQGHTPSKLLLRGYTEQGFGPILVASYVFLSLIYAVAGCTSPK